MAVRDTVIQKKRSRVPKGQRANWLQRYKTQTPQEIADEDGVSISAVWAYLHKKGVRARPMLRDHLDLIAVRRKAGATLQEIADDWGVSRQAVHIAIQAGPKKAKKRRDL